MQDVKITFRVRVSDDESRVIITEPTMTDSISFSVFTGVSSENLRTFRKNGTKNINPKADNNGTKRRETAYKETERCRV